MEFLVLILFLQMLTPIHLQYLKDREKCTPDGEVCLEFSKCSKLQEPVRKGFRPRLCSFNGTKEYICCSTRVEEEYDFRRGWNTQPSISERKCLEYLGEICPVYNEFIYGGEEAESKELPFMAQIGYGNAGDIRWLCGGSLISKYFVLSAAHCTQTRRDIASWVRLGELDSGTDSDDAQPQNFKIVERINHPDYNRIAKYNDIALYKLHKKVEFSDYIRPICLYQSSSLDSHKSAIAAGWGDTEKGYNSKLLKVDLMVYNFSECYKYTEAGYKRVLPEGLKYESQICSGVLTGGRDTCSGDSGGPLFLPPLNRKSGYCHLYTQIGITSFGPTYCGDKNLPGIYTKISAYLEWIESIVWNNYDSRPAWNK